MNIKALIIGSYGCGKTSFLASLLKELQSDKKISNLLNVNYPRSGDDNFIRQRDSLSCRISDMQELFCMGEVISITKFRPSHTIEEYDLHISDKLNNFDINIEFFDIPGSVIQDNVANKVIKINNYDIIIIAIDTPYLMESPKESIGLERNNVYEIENLLLNLFDNGGKEPKMVIFMPVKCEKWFLSERVEEIFERVTSVYKTSINILRRESKISMAIIPVQTIGNLTFEEFREQKLLLKDGNSGKKICCSPISDKIVRLCDGTFYKLEENDIIEDDLEQYLPNIYCYCPVPWYRVNVYHPYFQPGNCSQVPLHIIKFAVGKYLNSSNVFDITGKKSKIRKFGNMIDPLLKKKEPLVRYIKDVF